MGRLFLYSVISYLFLFNISCQEVDDLPEANNPDLIEFIEGEGLLILGEILRNYPNILAEIREQNEYTFFAPTDEAFEEAYKFVRVDNLENFVTRIGGEEYLEIYIKHHILSYAMDFSSLKDNQNLEPMSGVLLMVNRHMEIPNLRDANGVEVYLTKKDMKLDHNIIHIIDGMIWPHFSLGKADGELDLIAELSGYGYYEFIASVVSVTDLKSKMDDVHSISVFVPSNAAFLRLYQKFNVKNVEELIDKIGRKNFNSNTLFHIVPEMVWFAIEGEHVFECMNGEDLTITQNGDEILVIDSNGEEANLSRSVFDVAFTNGVFHRINEVMLPDLDFPIP